MNTNIGVMLGVVLIIILVSALVGYKRGLVKTVISAGAIIVAIFIASNTYSYVSKAIIDHTKIDESIKEGIEKTIGFDKDSGELTKNQEMTWIENYNAPDIIKTALVDNNTKDIYEGLNVTGFYEYVESYVCTLIINSISYVVIFVVVIVFCLCLLKAMDIITEIPIIGAIDKIGGCALGVAIAMMFIWIGCIVITIFSGTTWGQFIFSQINDSQILSYIYNHNLLLDIVTNITKMVF